MSKRSYLYFLSGVVVTAAFFSGYNIFASGDKVEAYIKSDYSIEVDGVPVTIPDGMRIINYVERTYTPARFIAEAMGGKVEWDDATKTIKITKPEPKVVEKIVEKEKIVEVPTESKKQYQNAPLKLNKDDFVINISNVSVHDNMLYVYLDAENKTGETVEVDWENAKVVTSNGDEYESNSASVYDWGNSMDTNEERKNGTMMFKKTDEKEITLSIPVKSLINGGYNNTFVFNLKVDQ